MQTLEEKLTEIIFQLHKSKTFIDWESLENDDTLFPENTHSGNEDAILQSIKLNLHIAGLIFSLPENANRTRLSDEGRKYKTVEKYLIAKSKEERRKRITDWPKQNWFIFQPVSFFLGIIATVIVTVLLQQVIIPRWPTYSKNKPTEQNVIPSDSLNHPSYNKSKNVDTTPKGQ